MCWQSHEQFVSLSTSTHTHTHTHTHTQGSRYASTCPTKAHVSSSSVATVAPRREAQRSAHQKTAPSDDGALVLWCFVFVVTESSTGPIKRFKEMNVAHVGVHG